MAHHTNKEIPLTTHGNPKLLGRGETTMSNVSHGSAGLQQGGFWVKKHANKRQAHYEMALGSVNAEELAKMDHALLDMTKNLYRHKSRHDDEVTKTRVDKSPRQLARLASLHKLPSRDESVSSAKSYGHVESVHSKLGSRHQSFLVRSSTTTGGKKSLGSRGSSFSFKRTNSPPEQITGWCRVISSHNGRSEQDDISSVSMSEIRTGSGNRTLNKFLRAQSAAEVLSNERVLSTHSQDSSQPHIRHSRPHSKTSPHSGYLGVDPSPKGSVRDAACFVLEKHRLEDDLNEEAEEDEEIVEGEIDDILDHLVDNVEGDECKARPRSYDGVRDTDSQYGSSVHRVNTDDDSVVDGGDNSAVSMVGRKGSPRAGDTVEAQWSFDDESHVSEAATASGRRGNVGGFLGSFTHNMSKLIRKMSDVDLDKLSDNDGKYYVDARKYLDHSDSEYSQSVVDVPQSEADPTTVSPRRQVTAADAMHPSTGHWTFDESPIDTVESAIPLAHDRLHGRVVTRAISQVSDLGTIESVGESGHVSPTESLPPSPEPVKVLTKERSTISSVYSAQDKRSVLESMSHEERLLRAVMHIRDALHERPIKDQRPGILATRIYGLQHSWFVVLVMRLIMIAHLTLVLFEPSGNRFQDESYPWSFSPYDCSDAPVSDNGTVIPLDCFSRLTPWFTRTICLAVETGFVLSYVADMGLSAYTHGWTDTIGILITNKQYATVDVSVIRKNLIWNCIRSFAVFAMLVDLAINWAGVTTIRFSRVLRPIIFVFKSRELRRWMYLILSTLPKITGLALLIFSFIAVYAIVGVLLFSEQEFYQDGRFNYANFDDFGKATVLLYVLMTSENFPYIMYPSYDADVSKGSHFFALFFVSFLLVIMFFLTNLAVPYLFGSFKKSHVEEALTGRIVERISLLASFQLLDFECKGFIELDRFKQLMRLIRKDLFDKDGCERHAGMVEFMFEELCLNHPCKCYPLDFFQLSEVILTEFEVADESLHSLQWVHRFMRWLSSIMTSGWTEAIVLLLVFANTTLLAFYSKNNPYNQRITDASKVFVFIFAGEIALKLLSIGPSKFFSFWKNRYDFIIVGGATVAAVLELTNNARDNMFVNPAGILISLRALRLIPALGIFDKLNVIVKILPFMYFSMLTVLLITYIFAIVGMEFFSKQFKHNLNVDAYSDVNVQFDNFVGALMILFQVLVSNNWDDVMYTAMYSTESVGGPASYFILFHFIAVSLLLQLVIAIYVEAFETFAVDHEEEKTEANNAQLAQNAVSTPKNKSVHIPPQQRFSKLTTQTISAYSGSKKSPVIYSTADTSASPSVNHSSQVTAASPSPGSGGRPRMQNWSSTRSLGSGTIPNLKQGNFVVKGAGRSAPSRRGSSSTIHSLARKHMKEFEEVELDRIKALGDFDVSQEMVIRQEQSRRMQSQLELREAALREILTRPVSLRKVGTFASLSSFEDSVHKSD